MKLVQSWLNKQQQTQWQGEGELWLDPEGNHGLLSEVSLSIQDNTLSYQWWYDEKPQQGELIISPNDTTWRDSWHQPQLAHCKALPCSRALCAIEFDYPAPPGPDWGWKIKLSQRPDDTLVLQMTNVTPWGEEGRAVRMVLKKQ